MAILSFLLRERYWRCGRWNLISGWKLDGKTSKIHRCTRVFLKLYTALGKTIASQYVGRNWMAGRLYLNRMARCRIPDRDVYNCVYRSVCVSFPLSTDIKGSQNCFGTRRICDKFDCNATGTDKGWFQFSVTHTGCLYVSARLLAPLKKLRPIGETHQDRLFTTFHKLKKY